MRVLDEACRVLRPGGHLLVAFQTGDGVRDVAAGYRKRGHDIVLMRWGRRVTWMTAVLRDAGFEIVASLDRDAVEGEHDGQSFVVARAAASTG